jgi:hypothetical protein
LLGLPKPLAATRAVRAWRVCEDRATRGEAVARLEAVCQELVAVVPE